jgi:hypothetical protein
MNRETVFAMLDNTFPTGTWISINKETGEVIASEMCQSTAQIKTINWLKENKKRGSIIIWHISGIERNEVEV